MGNHPRNSNPAARGHVLWVLLNRRARQVKKRKVWDPGNTFGLLQPWREKITLYYISIYNTAFIIWDYCRYSKHRLTHTFRHARAHWTWSHRPWTCLQLHVAAALELSPVNKPVDPVPRIQQRQHVSSVDLVGRTPPGGNTPAELSGFGAFGNTCTFFCFFFKHTHSQSLSRAHGTQL